MDVAASVIGGMVALPQVIMVVRSGKTRDVSAATTLLTLASSFLWAWWSIRSKNYALLGNSATVFLCQFIIFGFIIKNKMYISNNQNASNQN